VDPVIDFTTLYEHPISKPCTLWERCNSHCCTIGRLLRPFDPGADLVVLPIPAPEYEHLRRIGAPEQQWPGEPKKVELRVSTYSLTLFMQPCNLGGACQSELRPAICRLYPYVPLLDDDLQVRSIMNASALDLLWDAKGIEDPCLMRSSEERQRYLESMKDLIDRLRRQRDNLELFLWFNLAFRYVEGFKRYLEQNLPAAGVPSQDLFRILHLCNRTQLFLSDPEFRQRIDGEVERFHRWRR
jgi:hypothetical protein